MTLHYAVPWIGSVATDMSRIAIVAAMERELRPLVRNWKSRTIEQGGRKFRIFEKRCEKGEVAVVCGGIGAEAARRATQAVIQEMNPGRVLSVGFAGALDASLQVGDVLEPRTVINAADGARTDTGAGAGVLVSSGSMAGREHKPSLARAYSAAAVDMEAAAVAQGAQAEGVEFGALKAISDAADFSLPVMDGFVAGDGTFRSLKFASYVAVRPWLWGTTIALARNSARASRALCEALERYLDHGGDSDTPRQRNAPGESSGSGLNPTKGSPEFASAHTTHGPESHT